MSKIDLVQLEKELRGMTRQQPLYKMLKRTLSELGYWRNKPRGDSRKGFKLGWGKDKNASDV
jgi:hypothetical protein